MFVKLLNFLIRLLSIIENYICTHDHQFGFKKQHATDMCIYTVKSVIKDYKDLSVDYVKVVTQLYKPLKIHELLEYRYDIIGLKQGWGQVQLTKYSSTPNTYQVQVKYSFF